MGDGPERCMFLGRGYVAPGVRLVDSSNESPSCLHGADLRHSQLPFHRVTFYGLLPKNEPHARVIRRGII